MAVEAQLCPQCGGSIHFAASQTRMVCPYCGTTVDLKQATAAGETAAPRRGRAADLSHAQLQHIKELILEGQRAEALAFIQQNLGEDDDYWNKVIDTVINGWATEHAQTHTAKSLTVILGHSGAAVLQKVVGLALFDAAALPPGSVITRLVLDVAGRGQPARTLEIKLVLPAEMTDRLQPGTRVEVITHGTEVVYVSDPIKVVG